MFSNGLNKDIGNDMYFYVLQKNIQTSKNNISNPKKEGDSQLRKGFNSL